MSVRLRLALAFALVAVITATAIALVTPAIVDHGFKQVATDSADAGRGAGQAQGAGPREGRGPGRAQRETTVAIVLVAIVGAASASVLGFLIAGRLVAPLSRLRDAAASIASGDLEVRSGVTDRSDEIGELGRSFDAMAAAIERSDLARRRMFQDAAHELKTPLTVIDATTTAILDGVYTHDDRHLETIRGQTQLLARTVDDLRTVSLAETGQMPLQIVELAVAEVLGRVFTSFAAPAELTGVRLGLGALPEGLRVRADSERIQQLLGALVDNALRHTPQGGHITLEASAARGMVRLVVRDSGPGISSEDLPHLFERFYRADPSRQRSTGTSGLGLAIVSALALAQGGSAGAQNSAGGGALFWVELPSGGTASGIKGT